MTTVPQIIWLVLAGLSLFMHAAKDGEPRGNYDFSGAIAAAAISFGILYWGGFFVPLFGAK